MLKADTRESFLDSLPSFSADKVQAYKEAFQNLLPKGSGSFESEADKTNFAKLYMRKIQVLLEKKMARSIANTTPFYDNDLLEILRFSYWASEKGFIDAYQPFVILEDIYDCLSINEIQSYFEFLEELVKSLNEISSIQQQALLRIGIGILKKFSKVHENEFRGRVQLFLAKITTIVFETAVNLKSALNTSNQTTYDSNPDAFDNMANFGTEKSRVIASRISFSFYQKFWELQKFLHNPGLLFNPEHSLLIDTEEAPNEDGEIETKPKQTKKPTQSKVEAFCKLIIESVDLFKSDPVIENEDVPYERRYPKYFTKFSLLSTQLRDPNFRKTWICQVIICLWSVKNPIKIKGQKQFEIGEKDLEKLTNLEKVVLDYAKTIKDGKEEISFYDKLTLFLERERKWLKWKEDGCKSFEKPIKPPSLKEKIEESKAKSSSIDDLIAQVKDDYIPQPALKKPDLAKLCKDSGFEKDNNLFTNLKQNPFPSKEDPIEPSVDYYFNPFLSELADETLNDSDRLCSDELEAWRAFRVLARYNISLLFNTLNQKEKTLKTDYAELKMVDILRKITPQAPKEEEPKASATRVEEEKQEAQPETREADDAQKDEVVEIKPTDFNTPRKEEPKVEEVSEKKLNLEQLKAEATTPIKDIGAADKDKPAKDSSKNRMIAERLDKMKAADKEKEKEKEREKEKEKEKEKANDEVKEVKEVKEIKEEEFKNGHEEKNGKKSPSNGKRPAEEEIVELERQPSETKKTKTG